MRRNIVGAGRVGRRVVEQLDSGGQSITVIEPDPETCEQLSTKHNRVIQGDGTDPETLGKANLSEPDVVAALTDNTELNLTVCETAKERAPDVKTLLRIARDSEQDYGDRTFVDHTVSPAAAGADVGGIK